MQLIGSGRGDRAVELLQAEVERQPDQGAAWKLLGMALHEEQLEPEAVAALRRARQLAPRDAEVAMALAQSCLYAGYPAVQPFVDVMRIDPHNLDALRGYALAVTASGDSGEAVNALSAALTDYPGWTAGHKLLASLRYTHGDTAGFAASYAGACDALADSRELYLAWFRSVAQVRDWDQARAVIDKAVERHGMTDDWLLAQLFVASESGDDAAAERLFEQTAALDDVTRDMALVRFSIRRHDLPLAEEICLARVRTASANVFWPYLGLVWRLRGDDRWQWLERDGDLVAAEDLDYDPLELEALASRLRSLHSASHPYAEQSVRGGTQTDQNLFLRHEPEIRVLRDRVRNAVSRYVARLPERDPEHPFLCHERGDALCGRVHFSGSWSVRLQAQGRNVPHTHPMGWISSALYVALPAADAMGEDPAGWIQFGTPPAELNLDLDATTRIRPVTARLALFPSISWHSTVPFEAGERLVVAFDVRPPR